MSDAQSNTSYEPRMAPDAGADLTEDQRMAAANKLMELRQEGAASKYGRLFRDIASPLGWDDQALMAMFYRGLKNDVKDALCMKDRPEKLDEYIAMAVEIDDRLYTRRLEKRLAR